MFNYFIAIQIVPREICPEKGLSTAARSMLLNHRNLMRWQISEVCEFIDFNVPIAVVSMMF